MVSALTILLGVAMAAVVAVLLTGVIGFARGGAFNRKYSQRLMMARVLTQAVAVALLGLLVLLRGQ